MSIRSTRWVLIASICLAQFLGGSSAGGQQAAAGPNTAGDAEQKAKILQSDCWRRAMFELNEWLRVQSVYPPDEVARIKADFATRVEQMSAKELQLVLTDLEAKFRVLDSQEAREVRAWLGNYLSIISTRRRDELLKTIPDFASMSSLKLQQTIDRLAQRRDTRMRTQDQLQQLRQSASNPWSRGSAPASRPAARSGYRSPYRPQSFERPFDNIPAGGGRSRMIDPNGQIWMTMGFWRDVRPTGALREHLWLQRSNAQRATEWKAAWSVVQCQSCLTESIVSAFPWR